MLSGTSARRSSCGAASTRSARCRASAEVALHHRAVAVAAVGAQRRPDRQRAGAPRVLGRQEAGVGARVVGRREVGRADVEGPRQPAGVAHEREAAVVGHVQPLVPVAGDRVRALDSLGQRTRLRREAREQAEGAVDVQPGAVRLGQVGDRGDRVEVAGVDLAGVGDHDRRPVVLGQPSLERVEVEAPGCVARQPLDVRLPQAEHPDGLHRARMDVAAAEDRRRGQRGQPRLVDVDALALGPPRTGRGERDDVRHRRPAGEHAAELLGQLEQLPQPVGRDRVEPRRQRRRSPGEGGLVEGGGQPIRRQRRRRAAAHHEVEEARPARARGGVASPLRQLCDRGERPGAVLGHRIAPGPDRTLDLPAQHGLRVEALEVAARLRGRQLERVDQLLSLVERIRHETMLPRRRV